MDAPSPIATTPEARSRQLRALKRADSARRAATPAAGSRGATPQQFSPTNAVGMGALFAPGGDVTPVRRSARSSRASSTPGEDLPPEAARFVAQVMSPEQPPLPPIVADPAAEARKKRALRKARKAAAAARRTRVNVHCALCAMLPADSGWRFAVTRYWGQRARASPNVSIPNRCQG